MKIASGLKKPKPLALTTMYFECLLSHPNRDVGGFRCRTFAYLSKVPCKLFLLLCMLLRQNTHFPWLVNQKSNVNCVNKSKKTWRKN